MAQSILRAALRCFRMKGVSGSHSDGLAGGLSSRVAGAEHTAAIVTGMIEVGGGEKRGEFDVQGGAERGATRKVWIVRVT